MADFQEKDAIFHIASLAGVGVLPEMLNFAKNLTGGYLAKSKLKGYLPYAPLAYSDSRP